MTKCPNTLWSHCPQTQYDSRQDGGGGEGGEQEVGGRTGQEREQTVNEMARMGVLARGKVEQMKEDISLLVERMNTILMSNI